MGSGYPISSRFTIDGFALQAFQNGSLRWSPPVGVTFIPGETTEGYPTEAFLPQPSPAFVMQHDPETLWLLSAVPVTGDGADGQCFHLAAATWFRVLQLEAGWALAVDEAGEATVWISLDSCVELY